MRTDGYDVAALERKSFYKPAPPDYDNGYEHNVKKEAANCNYKAVYAAYAKKQRDAANAETKCQTEFRKLYSLKAPIWISNCLCFLLCK